MSKVVSNLVSPSYSKPSLLQVFSQDDQDAEVQGFDSSHAATQYLANLGVGHPLHELEDEQLLAVGREPLDGFEEGLSSLVGLGLMLRDAASATLSGQGPLIQGDNRVSAAVTEPVSQQVVGNSIEPGREGQALVLVAIYVGESAVKSPGGEVFGVVAAAGAAIDVAIDLPHVLFV